MCYRYEIQRFSQVEKYYSSSESQYPLQRHDKLVLTFATNDLSFLSLLNGLENEISPKYHFSSLLWSSRSLSDLPPTRNFRRPCFALSRRVRRVRIVTRLLATNRPGIPPPDGREGAILSPIQPSSAFHVYPPRELETSVVCCAQLTSPSLQSCCCVRRQTRLCELFIPPGNHHFRLMACIKHRFYLPVLATPD